MDADKPKATTVDEYIDMFQGPTRAALIKLRLIARELAPTAEEVISYAIPTYKVNGRPKLYFAGYERHVSLYPLIHDVPEDLRKELEPHISGRGTLRFNLSEPLPEDLIRRAAELMLKS